VINGVACQDYIGHFSIAAQQCGVNIIGKVEREDAFGIPPWKANAEWLAPNLRFIRASNSLEWPLENVNAQVVYGNPPCSAFSQLMQDPKNFDRGTAGIGGRQNQCMFDLVEYGGRLFADVVAFESVRNAGIQGRRLMYTLHDRLEAITKFNYHLTLVFLNALSVGGYQNRARFFWVASKHGPVSFPTPAELQQVNEQLRRRIAERDLAIAELQHEKAQRLKSEEALAQSRKMDALGQLTGGIAHDFNNLLQSVQGSLELIGRRASDAGKVRELADRAMHSAERGAKLTAQLLAFARSKQLKLEPFVVSDFVLGVRDLLGGAAGNMIDLRFGLESGDLAVMADRTQLELALLNLVINARDASPDGGRIVIGARRLDVGQGDADLEPGAYVELSVADTGVGMSPEVRARAFEPFFSTKDVGQGTGLGLSQVYGLARQAGGVARLESAEGQGTVVSLILPITEHAAAAETPRTPQAAAAPRTGLVLVVDDDADVRAFAAAALDTFGHTVLQAPGGGEALASMKAQLPDAVLLDYAMPGMNGAEVARIIARNHPKVPIIFMTGYADAAALEPILGHKATVLRKPFRVDELGYALAGALARGVAGGG